MYLLSIIIVSVKNPVILLQICSISCARFLLYFISVFACTTTQTTSLSGAVPLVGSGDCSDIKFCGKYALDNGLFGRVDANLCDDGFFNLIQSVGFFPRTNWHNGADCPCRSTVADLGGASRVPWNPPFGFSCNRKF